MPGEVARKQPRQPSTQTWMANALHIRPATAKHERLLAEALRARPVLAAGLAGTVCVDRAAAILTAITEIPADYGPACRDEVEKALVEQGNHQSPWQLRLHGEETRANLDQDRYDREQAAQLARRERHAIATRDRHCVHPGCERPARWCAYHHIHTTSATGRRRHHRPQQRRAALWLSPRPL